MAGKESVAKGQRRSTLAAARNDVIVAAVTFTAIVLFVANGSLALNASMQRLFSAGGGSERVGTVALFLNIALILFAWRRYKDLRCEVEVRTLAEERAEALASRDQLTNLLIRHSLLEQGAAAIERARGHDQSLAMMILDLDQFKKVNDVYGHIAGDSLLRSVADVIERLMPRGALCARTGGDKFSVLLPFHESEQKSVGHIADRLLARLAEPFEITGVEIHLGASIGLARLAPDCGDMDALLRRADIAMHAAKKGGRRRAVWFDKSMESVLRARNEVEAGLRRGVPLGEFVPYYQPQIEIASGTLQGFEVLARWAHPTGGVVGPDVFIPVAEETGMISDLFETILRQALEDASSWDAGLTLAVNLSPGQLKDTWLAPKILKLLSESRFPPERLEIEITETSLFDNLVLAQQIVGSLKNHGVRLALDDFGTGYSSLSHLRALPFDRIKIDRSFVQSMNKDPESWAIVNAVTRMGESLGVSVTAEGVEDKATEARLRSIGCEAGQGWLYGHPLSAKDALELLGDLDLLTHATVWAAASRRAKHSEELQRRAAAG